MKKIILILPILFFITASQTRAAVLVQDGFENGLSSWQISGGSTDTTLDTDQGSTHKNILRVNYSGNNEHILVKQSVPSSLSDRTNLIYEIEFWDDPQRNYGAGFYVSDANQQYIEFVVNGDSKTYLLRNGLTSFDTKISRVYGWHRLQIFVTQVGSYLAIDGQSLVYLRAKLMGGEDPSKFPINTEITHATEVGIEYLSWNKPVSMGYWDNFKVYEFRTETKTTSQKEEDVLIEFVGQYDNNFSYFQNPPDNLKGIQNFQLARLGLAAGYGVRAKKSGTTQDLTKMKGLLDATVNDYQNGWSKQDYESPISAQALAAIASWQWNNLDTTLKENVISLVKTVAEYSINIDPGRPNGPGDSKAEENAWFSSILSFAADFLPTDPQRQTWLDKAKALACNSTSSLTTNSKYPCEKSQVLTPDFLLINHGMVNPSYALTIPWGFSQATLFALNSNQSLPGEFTKNLLSLYQAGIAPLIRPENYTYKAYSPTDKLLFYTARDDWGQDATLQDNGWAYLDKVLGLNKLDAVVNYAWLTRASGTIYPSDIAGLSDWMSPISVDCGDGTNCAIWKENSGLHFFLNGMDAIDRFMTLFIINPADYKLNPYQTSTPTPKPGDLNGDTHVDIFDYNLLVANFGNPYTIFDYNALVGNFGK